MVQDASHFLNELPIWKLKVVASEYGVDASTCKTKRDYVERIRAKRLTEEQVRKALGKAKKEPSAEGKDSDAAAREIEEIAAKPPEARELPADDEKSVEKNIDAVLGMKPTFFEVDSAAEAALNRMIVGDFTEAIKVNREARMKCLDSFSTFQIYSAAISIRAADQLLSKIPDSKGKLNANLRTAVAAAKRAFLGGSPRQREEALESLESLAAKTYEAYIADSESDEKELADLLTNYESFGTRTQEARKYLQIAASAKQAFDLTQYRSYLGSARQAAESAKEERSKEIDNIFKMVRASAAEALELGATVSDAEEDISQARKAFDKGQFKRSVELLADVARATDAAHLERLRAEQDLEAKQIEKVKSTVLTYGPTLQEAHSYGVDVREGMTHLENAKVALGKKDVISAAVFARRVRELADPLDKDLHEKRLELGVIKHAAGAKCGKCGKESLFQYPNGTLKCRECGHSFSTAMGAQPEAPVTRVRTLKGQESVSIPEAPPVQAASQPAKADEKKRKGLFRW